MCNIHLLYPYTHVTQTPDQESSAVDQRNWSASWSAGLSKANQFTDIVMQYYSTNAAINIVIYSYIYLS